MGVVWTFLLSSIFFSPLSPSLWETARYRLKYCLKGPLNPKQPTNQLYSGVGGEGAGGWVGAKVLGNLQCRGALIPGEKVRQGPAVLAEGAGWAIFILLSMLSFLSFSFLSETARYD